MPVTNERVYPLGVASDVSSTRPMLARDADATYWMSRYVERTEHISRLLLVNNETLLDVREIATPLIDQHWQSVLEIMHAPDLPEGDAQLPLRVAEFMTFDMKNPNSVINCLTRARENARGIREVISTNMWEHLNVLYWAVLSDESRSTFLEVPDQLHRQIIAGSMLFQGLSDQTLAHGERWYFIQLGKCFERIVATCRILRVKHAILRDVEEDSPIWNIHWGSVLKSCGSIEAYRRSYLNEIDLKHIAQFLILEPTFPRSVRYCVREAHQAISTIRMLVRPRQVDPAERLLGRLDAQLDYAEPNDLLVNDFGNYLSNILDTVNQAALSVQRSFFLH